MQTTSLVLGVNQCEPFQPFIGRRPDDGKGQSREPLLLQDLSQHGGRDLIGPIMGRKTDYPGVKMFRGVRYRSGVFPGQLILGKLGDHFVDAEKEELFPGCVNRSFVPVLFGHAQSRDRAPSRTTRPGAFP